MNGSDNGIVDIHGKQYKTVAYRVTELRESRGPNWSIQTELIGENDKKVIMKATIIDSEDRIIGTGFAEEVRGSTNINKTSALENAETSAIGRALAACGFAGTEYASADEVANAISQQKEQEIAERYIRLCHAITELALSILTIKANLGVSDPPDAVALEVAAEVWYELSKEEKKSIWVAPTKGGPFTTREREIMKSTEFKEAYHVKKV